MVFIDVYLYKVGFEYLLLTILQTEALETIIYGYELILLQIHLWAL